MTLSGRIVYTRTLSPLWVFGYLRPQSPERAHYHTALRHLSGIGIPAFITIESRYPDVGEKNVRLSSTEWKNHISGQNYFKEEMRNKMPKRTAPSPSDQTVRTSNKTPFSRAVDTSDLASLIADVRARVIKFQSCRGLAPKIVILSAQDIDTLKTIFKEDPIVIEYFGDPIAAFKFRSGLFIGEGSDIAPGFFMLDFIPSTNTVIL